MTTIKVNCYCHKCSYGSRSSVVCVVHKFTEVEKLISGDFDQDYAFTVILNVCEYCGHREVM